MPSVEIEKDFCGWIADQATRLRALKPRELDWENLAEEIESMGRSDRREIKNRLTTLFYHLLKWRSQPDERERRGRGWQQTMIEARRKVEDLIEESPSLQTEIPSLLVTAWKRACEQSRVYVPNYKYPDLCPWSYAEFMSDGFLPPDKK